MSHIDYASDSKYARVTGFLYLIIIICAGFAEGYVRSSLITSGDIATTASNILASKMLFRIGLVSDLIAFMTDAIVAVLLYLLLKPVSKPIAIIAAVLRLIAHPAIGSLNLINHLEALQILESTEYLASFDINQLYSMAMQSLAAHETGYLIAGAFFGLHCVLLGHLLFKSELFPKTLGILILLASIGYLTESLGTFLAPAYHEFFSMVVVIPAVLAELSLCLWLMIKGVRKIPMLENGKQI